MHKLIERKSMARLEPETRIVSLKDFSTHSFESVEYYDNVFESCNFAEAVLRGAKFSSCTFKDCNFSLVKLDGVFIQDVQFVDCKIVGAQFFKCARTFFSAHFRGCFIHYCSFADLNMKNTSFSNSKLKECHFNDTVLTGSSFDGADLSGTIFHNSNLSKCDFSKAVNYTIDPTNNNIKKAKFSLPEAVGLLHGFDIILE